VPPTREVDDLVFGYGATGGAFAIDEGEVRVIVRGGTRPGSPAEVESSPTGGEGRLYARVETAPADSSTRVTARHFPESRRLVIEGHVRVGAVDTLAFAQRDPVRWASAELAAALARAGVQVRGGWSVQWTRGDSSDPRHPSARATAGTLVAALESPPLSEIVAEALGPSQNWLAEQLLYTLGAEVSADPEANGSSSDGLDVLRSFLFDEIGIEATDVRPRDGSGLSAYNLVTPRALARTLLYMDARPDGRAYRRALAEPLEPDSTLEDRLAGLEGRLFAKTGSISNVNTLSGFVVGTGGRDVVFSILTNATGASADEVRDAIDAIVRVLAR
jgi:D-alanyl-D-alanine carboxypeptidase/D-alanyl-D-alanine-endopeptidase (penicillin-binding protein 4)